MFISPSTRTTISLRDVSLLIVDDSIVVRSLIRWALKSSGAGAIRAVGDVGGALRVLERFSPDIILVNWRAQPVDGLAFIRRVRDPETGVRAYVRIVMMSRCTRSRQVLAARDAGVDAVLLKPLSRSGLLAGIRAMVDNPRPFSRTEGYFGPDRRRKQIAHDGPERRQGEETVVPAEAVETGEACSPPTPRTAAQGSLGTGATLQR